MDVLYAFINKLMVVYTVIDVDMVFLPSTLLPLTAA